jgi:type II secretory pathway component PulF
MADRGVFYQQLAVALHAGLPPPAAVRVAGAPARMGATAESIAAACAAGRPLAEALGAHGEPALAVALVDAGERCGRSAEQCRRLGEIYLHRAALTRRLLARLPYPCLLLLASTTVPLLPGVVQGARGAWQLLVGPGVLLAIAAAVWFLWPRIAALRDRWAWLPGARQFAQPWLAATAGRVIGAGLAAGLKPSEAVDLAASTVDSASAVRLRESARALRDGATTLPAALATARFPLWAVETITAGSVSGSDAEQLDRIATVAEEQFAWRLDWLVRIVAGTIYGLAMLIAAITIISFYAGYIGTVQQVLNEAQGS